MRLPVFFLDEASDDLDEIHLYFLREVSETLADRMLAGIRAALHKIANQPEIGTPKGEVLAGLRMWMASKPAHQYKIFYRVVPNAIEVLRVIHGMRSEAEIFDDEG